MLLFIASVFLISIPAEHKHDKYYEGFLHALPQLLQAITIIRPPKCRVATLHLGLIKNLMRLKSGG